jgi:hypothetical protein
MPFTPPLLGAVGAYNIQNSVIFDGSSDDMRRTMSAGDSTQIASTAMWFKRVATGSDEEYLMVCSDDGGYEVIGFNASNKLHIWYANQGNNQITTATYASTSVWVHALFNWDSTDASGGERGVLYINGEEVNTWDTDTQVTQNTNFSRMHINTEVFGIGRNIANGEGGNNKIADVVHTDGVLLSPSDFSTGTGASFITGIKSPAGISSFGSEGFWLDFSDEDNLGTDRSGNGNNFTLTSLSSSDASSDTPTADEG